MPFPCWKRGDTSTSAVPKGPSKKGNGTKTYADTFGMERGADNTVEKKPGWDGPDRVVETNG